MMFTLELLRRILKSVQPSQPLIVTPIFFLKKHPLFFVCLHLKLLKMFLSMALKPPSQDQKA